VFVIDDDSAPGYGCKQSFAPTLEILSADGGNSQLPILAETGGGEIIVAPTDNLLSLISRASTALANARTMAETVQAMKLAQAAKELGRIIGAANEARADCLRVEMLAQIRIAREYEAAQARGEVATQSRHPGSVQNADTAPATADELGLDRRRVAEWRKMATAGEAVVLGAISDALAKGREATAAEVRRAIVGGFGRFTGNNEYYTPAIYVDAAREVMGGIDLDPASCEVAQKTVRATAYYTQDDCGLSKDWHGPRLVESALCAAAHCQLRRQVGGPIQGRQRYRGRCPVR
jgi:hypothetical protein